jgi:hypothetical protein
MTTPRPHYERRKEQLTRQLAATNRRFDLVSWARLVTLLTAVALVVARTWLPLGIAGWLAAATASCAFVGLVAVHARLAARRHRVQTSLDFIQRALSRMDGKWASFPEDGKDLHRDDHPYALDLDVFGPGSLYQLLNDTRTHPGRRRLGLWLSEPADATVVAQRQQAVRELSGLHELREGLAVAGVSLVETNPDPEPFLVWASGEPHLRVSPGLKALMWALPTANIALLVAAPRASVAVWAFAIAFGASMLVLARLGPRLRPAIQAASQRSADFERFARLLVIVESGRFEAPLLRRVQARLQASGFKASVELGRLARIVSTLEARENGAFRAIFGPLLLWDLHGVAALERWQRRVGPHVRDWLDALADFEAMASLATFAFEHPSYAWPEVDSGPLHFEAVGLGHPLLDPSRLVVNDVALPEPGSALLVTGSNMSGKSTLLRSMGVAAVLALAGAPVCARSLRVSVCAVRTSMRISDSVRDGVSRFYAEILKIKGVVDTATQGQPVLFLLDEVLHGTNSRERHLGARAVLRALLQAGAIGAISTHDLALADLSDLTQGSVRTVHFQEQVDGDKMTFDYRLRDGLVRSGNALRWMRIVGLPVPEDVAQENHASP